MYILLIMVPILGIAVLIMGHTSSRGSSGSRLQFHSQGKAAGFTPKEIGILRNIAQQSDIDDYTSLFQSPEQLDRCIRTLVRTLRIAGEEEFVNQNFLSKLYEYRKKIEIDASQPKQSISTSRQIGEDQRLQVMVNNSVVYQSRVIKNINPHIIISWPVNSKVTTAVAWCGMKLSVYFWRNEDAGYVFDCTVLDEVHYKGAPALHISHSDSLFRTQKRKSVRIKTHKSAFLYMLNNNETADRLETVPGLKCFLEDLSDTGCAVTIGGMAHRGMRVKLQFILDNNPLILCGTVRSIEYNLETNRSLLHIEADPLHQEAKNSIFGEVFGMLPEDNTFIPFRLTEEEVKKLDN